MRRLFTREDYEAIEARATAQKEWRKITHRTCTKCAAVKPINQFNVNYVGRRYGKLSRRAECKACQQANVNRSQSVPYEQRPQASSLNPWQCNEIRRLFDAGGFSQRELSDMFGVSQKTIWLVTRYRPQLATDEITP